MENVLEVVQAAGWEVSHWRIMLSGNDGSGVGVQVELMDGCGRTWICRLTEGSAVFSHLWLERMCRWDSESVVRKPGKN